MKGKMKKIIALHCENVRELDRMILELQIEIRNIQQEKKKILKSCQNQPSGINSFDYSAERVKGGNVQLSVHEALSRIDGLQKNMNRLFDEKRECDKKRRDLVRQIKNDAEESPYAGVFYWRYIKGLSQEATAEEIGYSIRQVQRLEQWLKEEWKGKHDGRKK